MSLNVFHKTGDGTGVLQKIAGHTILLDATASEVRKGRWNLVSDGVGWVEQNIIFTDSMPDNDYIVIIESDAQTWATQPGPYRITNKTTTGFTLASFNDTNATGQVNMNIAGTYTAFKLIELDGYTELQNKVNNPDSTPTEDSLNLVTSGGVYNAIKDSGKIWRGTQEEWDALPSADKDFYDQAEISGVNNDGMVYVADKIENGNMNAVTSNAVYDAIGTVSPMTVTKQGNYINGTNFHGRKAGKVATVEINGDTGASIPWEQITTVGVAIGCATPLTELKCTADMLSVTTGYDSNGNAITKWIPPYCRAWIGTNGEIQVFLANPGASDTSYTGNLFIGGSYVTQ